MPIEKIRRGSGITERDELILTGEVDDADIAELQRMLDAQDQTFEGLKIRPLEEKSEQVLSAAGMTFHRTGGLKIDDRFAATGTDYQDDSEIDYARRFLSLIRSIRDATARTNIEQVATWAFDLGALMREAEIKFEWEPAAMTGKRVRDGGARGGPPPGRTKQRDSELAQKYLRRQKESGLSATALKAKIGKDSGLGRSASIEAIDRGLKILSG